MAILWADGFDDWVTAGVAGEYESYSAAGGLSVVPFGRRSGSCLYLVSSGEYVQKALAASYAELFVRVAFRPSVAGNVTVAVFYNGATPLVSLRVNTDGSVSAYRGTIFDTLLGTSAPALVTVNVFTHFQIRVVFSASVGVVQVRLNGQVTNALSLTGANTGAATANAVRITPTISNASYWDDFVVSDTSGSVANSWLGDVRVDTYLPSGDGDLSQMTGSDGNSTSNYALVDAAAPNGTDYVQSATVGHEDLYQVADMTHNPTTIYGVLCTAAALKDDAGTRSIKLHAKSGATDSASAADIPLSTSRARVATVFELDPNTAAAWTKAGFNAAQFGFAVTV